TGVQTCALPIFLVFNPDGMDIDAARDRADQYRNEYLLEMLGVPGIVGDFIIFVNGIKQMLGLQAIEDQLTMLRTATIDAILLAAFGLSADELKDRVISPTALFDQIVNLPGYNLDRKSTRLHSSHVKITYACFR